MKCATITPDEARVKEFNLKQMWKSPNGTIRNILGGTIFREPIICKNVPRLVPGWTQPIVIGRHAFGDQYRATDFMVPGTGQADHDLRRQGRQDDRAARSSTSPAAASRWRMYNLDQSILDFARASMNYALARKYPLYLSTKNTILKAYDGRFKDCSRRSSTPNSPKFKAQSITYEHRLIDDMVAAALKWSRRLCLGLQELRRRRAVRHGRAGLRFARPDDLVLMTPDGRTVEAEAAHGTVTRHYREHQKGKRPRPTPIASIFAWTRGLRTAPSSTTTPSWRAFAERSKRSASTRWKPAS